MNYLKNTFLLITFAFTINSCDTSKMSKTSDENFVGSWKVEGRPLINDVEFQITKTKDGSFNGVITKLNDNKYVKLFLSEGDVIITSIKRKSNFEFTLSEKKVASQLFSSYGQSTSAKMMAQFDKEGNISLGENGANGTYIRLE